MPTIKKIALYSFLGLTVFLFAVLIGEIWFDIFDEGVLAKILMTVGLVAILDIIILAVLRDIKQEDDQTDKDLIL